VFFAIILVQEQAILPKDRVRASENVVTSFDDMKLRIRQPTTQIIWVCKRYRGIIGTMNEERGLLNIGANSF
jgi:hypothetical protein